MYRLVSKLIVYKNIRNESILLRLSEIFRKFESGNYAKDDLINEIYSVIHQLLDVATTYGFDRNLWHCYLAYILAMTENPFTLVSERVGKVDGSVNYFVRNDLAVFKRLFDFDFRPVESGLEIDCFSAVSDYKAIDKNEYICNKSVSEKIRSLSESIEKANSDDAVYEAVTDFYKRYGVGSIGLNKAFRVAPDNSDGILEPITSIGNMTLNDLVGYEQQKQLLVRNTEAFLAGRKANNVLLYGDAGTGKSTSIKALLNQFYDQGLRMIEVYKHHFRYLSKIIDTIKNRNYRFIIFMDDLSFEEFETDYKYLKAVIEGGLETRPENVLIYATSNRRHIIRETWGDRSDITDDDLHRSDTMQEKLSLADRFGLMIGYFRPSRSEYHEIVKALAKSHPEIKMPEEELLVEANRWEMRHGGLSGRTAQQFINYLAGTGTGTV
ncbi:MAG: ATP-binding protein [Clostridiales bacterium]|nr:ATP-binding protein [Clostridiales bacterium]